VGGRQRGKYPVASAASIVRANQVTGEWPENLSTAHFSPGHPEPIHPELQGRGLAMIKSTDVVAGIGPTDRGIAAVEPVSAAARPHAALAHDTEAVPVGEAALRAVLAAFDHDQASPSTAAADLLHSVEAILRSSAAPGLGTEDFSAAAAHLVEQQGLLTRLSSASPDGGAAKNETSWAPPADESSPDTVDTLL
jgi:hypothetical protein